MRVRSVLTSGGVECILGVLLFLVAINGWFSGTRHGTWNPWWDAVTLALLFAMTRWPRAGLAAMMAAACAGVVIDPLGYGMYHVVNACAVAMTVRRGQFALAVVGTVIFGCLLFYTSYGRAEPGQVVAVVGSTLIMYAAAWGLGLGIRGVVRAEIARVEAEHRERQFALAADLHDFVARNLTGLALAASSFPERMDRTAAEDLGDGPVRRFFRVTLPLAMPGVVAATLIVLIPTVGDFITPKLVGGTDGLMIANMIQIQFGKANNAPLGAALAVTSMLTVAAISLIVFLAGRRLGGRVKP